MDQTAAAFRHRRPATADILLGILQPQSSSSDHPIELFEHDIFNTPSGGGSSPSTNPRPNRHDYGILSALNGNLKIRSGSGAVFNRAAPPSLSSSSSRTSPAPSVSSRITIQRPPPPPTADGLRFNAQSAPIDVPVGLRRRAAEWEEEDGEEESDGVVLPPHEVVASRESPMLACSVLEGAGRTLKGRDLRQVRNAIWRKTGFID